MHFLTISPRYLQEKNRIVVIQKGLSPTYFLRKSASNNRNLLRTSGDRNALMSLLLGKPIMAETCGIRVSPLLGLFQFAPHRTCHIHKPDEAGNDAVGYHTSSAVLGQLETEATVDNTESDDDSSKPEMSVRPGATRESLEEEPVMEPAGKGLWEDEHEDDDSKD